MRVEIASQTGQPVPQFIIYAETDAERLVMQQFVTYSYYEPRPVFWLHGWTYGMGMTGVSSFNFGYRNRKRKWWKFWERT